MPPWAEKNKRLRLGCLEYIEDHCDSALVVVIVMRIAAVPILDASHQMLVKSGSDWLRRQAEQVVSGTAGSYPMTDAFKCKLELEAFEKIKRLLWALDDNWRILTTEQCTVKSRCLAFRILMRQIGVLKALLYDAAKGCPYMPFGILEGLI